MSAVRSTGGRHTYAILCETGGTRWRRYREIKSGSTVMDR